MKASEMTNEQIADAIERAYCASSSEFGLTMREAAARLRRNCKGCQIECIDRDAEASSLRSKLKVAEDALGESKVAVCHTCDKKYFCGHGTDKFDPCCIYKDIDNALAAIREEGGES